MEEGVDVGGEEVSVVPKAMSRRNNKWSQRGVLAGDRRDGAE